MASRGDSAGLSRPRARRSIAHVPRSRLTSGGDKENATTDIAASQRVVGREGLSAKEKKSRSKSLGPGGLDALQDSNGNRRKSTAAFPLKSILKPTVPVSPVRKIPTFEETRKKTPARGEEESTSKSTQEGLLIDFDTPAQQAADKGDDTANPFDTFNAATIRNDMAAAREQEEKERRERERKAALQQREARRKSMANRRVSFAPEATLHTWNVVEIPDDSTSSSASNSTRRASSLTEAQNQQAAPSPKQNEPLSSPEIDAASDIAFSPVQYPDLAQLGSRPASAAYDDVASSQDMFSSPFSGSEMSEDTGLHSISRDENDDDDDDDDDSESGFEGESTAMSMDDMSVHSAVSATADVNESTSGTSRLNEALRQAAREAGTRSVDHEEDEVSMEIADQEITGAFQPWIKKGQRQSFDWEELSARHDQENVDPAKAFNSEIPELASDNGDEDMSMEVTNAIGRIFSSTRQSIGRRRSVGEETNYEEQTMEFTNVIGGIAQPASPTKSVGANSEMDNDEEMTMEFTSVVGGLLKGVAGTRSVENHDTPSQDHNDSGWDNAEDDVDDGVDMEITGAVGGILPAAEEQDEFVDEDQTAGMDITTAVGKILTPEREALNYGAAQDTDRQMDSSPFQETVSQSPTKSPTKSPASFHVAAVASESGSPSFASVRSRRTRQSLSRATPTTPTSTTPQMSPSKNASALPKQLAPETHPSTPGQTPQSRGEDIRSASPKKLFQSELQVADSQRKSSERKNLFGNNAAGESAPLFVLGPPGARRSSGLGIDREGLGSPKVAAMLDKRRSIGEEATEFVPQDKRPQGVRFEDPLKLHEEVDREREEEESREDGHIPPLNDRDPTANLKDMISSLTPKKNKLRGRKSLHVGAARGLLGKRPAELDQDEEEDAENTPKRLRRPEDTSPVKSVRLPPPPTKEETVGRANRSPVRKSIAASPFKASTTPIQQPRNVSVVTNSEHNSPEAEKVETKSTRDETSEPEVEPIQLQDFLNMTNIHFMELTTTKRRHTTAPDSISRRAARLSLESDSRSSAANFENCVAAGFCTVPMLELYQHSCRELKSYISEGRQIIRSIETETYADNPPLFREYMNAAPDIRLLMDNQFRNVKTHTRLMSKATWYEWRMKLLEGLKEGLDRHMEDMKGDDNLLSQHEAILNNAVPALASKHSSLEQEATRLQQLADELENCDQDQLWSARDKLANIEEEIASKKKLLQELQEEVQDKTDTIETGSELKTEITAQIQEAERVKKECRGWSAKEIRELKDSVYRLEQQTGWSISSASSSESDTGPMVSMSYRHQLRLKFHLGSFYLETDNISSSDGKPATPIELSYSPDYGTRSTEHTRPLSPISSLILKSLQTHIAKANQSKTTPKLLLRFISEAWDLASKVEEETRMLGFHGVTNLRLSEVDDKPSLRARCMLLGAATSLIPASENTTQKATTSRIDVDFAVTTRILAKESETEIGVLDIQTEVLASKIYGFGTDNSTGLSEKEMRSILSKELKSHGKSGVKLGSGVWSKAVQMLSGKVF